MAKSVLYMSMSLDGFITGPDDGPGNGLGTGGLRLHEWLGEPVSEHPHFAPPGLSGQVFAEVMATGAVVVGRKTFDYAGHRGGDHHGVPDLRAHVRHSAGSRRAAGSTTCPTPRPRCVRPRRPPASRT
jgi:dihydrofolate reductase